MKVALLSAFIMAYAAMPMKTKFQQRHLDESLDFDSSKFASAMPYQMSEYPADPFNNQSNFDQSETDQAYEKPLNYGPRDVVMDNLLRQNIQDPLTVSRVGAFSNALDNAQSPEDLYAIKKRLASLPETDNEAVVFWYENLAEVRRKAMYVDKSIQSVAKTGTLSGVHGGNVGRVTADYYRINPKRPSWISERPLRPQGNFKPSMTRPF